MTPGRYRNTFGEERALGRRRRDETGYLRLYQCNGVRNTIFSLFGLSWHGATHGLEPKYLRGENNPPYRQTAEMRTTASTSSERRAPPQSPPASVARSRGRGCNLTGERVPARHLCRGASF